MKRTPRPEKNRLYWEWVLLSRWLRVKRTLKLKGNRLYGIGCYYHVGSRCRGYHVSKRTDKMESRWYCHAGSES